MALKHERYSRVQNQEAFRQRLGEIFKGKKKPVERCIHGQQIGYCGRCRKRSAAGLSLIELVEARGSVGEAMAARLPQP